MSQENVEIVRAAFEAFLEGDQEKTAQLQSKRSQLKAWVAQLTEFLSRTG